jgi:hypothetical protein
MRRRPFNFLLRLYRAITLFARQLFACLTIVIDTVVVETGAAARRALPPHLSEAEAGVMVVVAVVVMAAAVVMVVVEAVMAVAEADSVAPP